LEREVQRNLELMWLLGCLTPDFKTIANFRKDNPSNCPSRYFSKQNIQGGYCRDRFPAGRLSQAMKPD
jgi:transposase